MSGFCLYGIICAVMKKIYMILICLLLAGCASSDQTIKTADTQIYKSFYEDLYNQTAFVSESSYFQTSLEMAATDQGTYTYAVIIDEPAAAMYGIRAMVLENDMPYDQADKLMPSSGIIDDSYALIPNQVNKSSGYAKGIALRGTTDENSIEIRLLVEWRTEHNETRREYLRWQLSEEGAVPIRA